MSNADVYLRAAMSLIARQTFSPDRLAEVVSSQMHSKTLEAFNLCDGKSTQSEVASKLGIDQGQFSKTVKRWIDEGVLIKVDQDGGTKLVHVYPIPDRILQAASKKVSAKNGQRQNNSET